MRASKCLQETKPYIFVELNRKKAALVEQGVDVVTLSVGDPDGSTPDFIVDAAVEALRNPDNHHYPSYAGQREFREAAASYLYRRFGVEVDPETQLLALIGSKEGLAHLGNAFLDEGEYALVPEIGYPTYAAAATLRSAQIWKMPMNAENGYLADFECTPPEVINRAKMMFLGYPNNPTGACATESYFDAAIDFCRKNDLLLVHDNAYCDICYDGYRAPALLGRPGAMDCAIELFSLSKGYNMTGWRIAFAAGNAEAIRALSTIKSNIDTGINKAIQHAGAVALTQGYESIQAQCVIYQRRRDRVVDAFNAMGLACEKPMATIYVWVRVPEGFSSMEFCDRLLNEAHVAVAPGSGYGPAGEGFIRVSLTSPDERIDAAIERIRCWMRENAADMCS